MAQEADAPPESAVHARPDADDDETARLPRGSSPVDTLISPRLWKHAVVATLCLSVWGGVLALGDHADQTGSGAAGIIGLAAGKLTTFFSTVMLLAAGQLAFINLWYRSRSRKDFSGSYKLWFYTAVGWLGLCAFRATGTHWTFADAALAGRPFAIWNARLILWLIPAAIVVVSLYRLLLREMRDCPLSLWTLRLSGVAAGAASVVLIGGEFLLSSQRELLASAGLATLWHVLLALAMLLHARHVIHVSNEPPKRSIEPWRWPRVALPHLRLPLRRPATVTETQPLPSKARRKASPRKAETVTADASSREEVLTDTPETLAVPQSEVVPRRAAPAAEPAPTVTPPTAVARAAAVIPAKSAPVVHRRVDPPAPVAATKPHFNTPAEVDHDESSAVTDWRDDESEDEGGGRVLSKKARRKQQKLARQR